MSVARYLRQADVLGFGIAIVASLALYGCGGGGNEPSGQISGTAATGAPITSANVSIKDKNGRTTTGRTGADGRYTINVSNMTAPFLLRVPSDNGYLYSVATANGTTNIHPYTDLIIQNWYKAQGSDVATDFDSASGLAKIPTATEIGTIETVIRSILSANMAHDSVATSFNLLTSDFSADSTGFDKVLDNTKVVIDTATGGVTVTASDATTGITGTIVSTTAPIDTAADTAAPTAPTGLAALPASTSSVVLTWTASADNVGIAGYNIYRDGSKIATSPYPVYTDSGRTSGTSYVYEVEALDGAGNVSAAKSNQSTGTPALAADTSVPSTPAVLTATAVSASQINLSWAASTDNVGVIGYAIYRGAVKVAAVNGSTFSDTGLAAGTAYTYTVKAVDSAMNYSLESNSSSATTQPGIPSSPAGIVATAGDGQATISWNAVSGATSYNLYWSTSSGVTKNSGTKVTGVTSPYTHSGRTNGATYYYVVTAVNSSGEGVESAQASAKPMSGMHTMSGTYNWNASTSVLVLNQVSSNICGHPAAGVETETGVTISSTTLAYTNGSGSPDSWTRPSGTAGSLLGAWPTMDSATGKIYTLTFNADNTFSITVAEGACSTTTVATASDFAGSWGGTVTMYAPAVDATHPAESSTAPVAVALTANGNQVSGSIFTKGDATHRSYIFSISGAVANGVYSFNFPTSSPTNPDCANWNMPATITFDASLTTATLNSSGTVCGLNGGKPGTLTMTATRATGTKNASGTYTWDAATGAMGFNWTSSTFATACTGPGVGAEAKSGVTVAATTMMWTGVSETWTWTRSSGSADNIVGTWSATSSYAGNIFTLTYNANGTASVSANVVGCDSGGSSNASPSTVTMDGHVYAQDGVTPIAGAVISTSLDAVTATTDASGYFSLVTNTAANYSATPYTVTVAAAGYLAGGGTGTWGDHPTNQVFTLAP